MIRLHQALMRRIIPNRYPQTPKHPNPEPPDFVVLAVTTVAADPGERLGAELLVVRDRRMAVPASADPVLDEVELRLDVHARRNADRSDEMRMEVVARASGLPRAVSGFRTFPVAEDGLHRARDKGVGF